MPNPLTRVIELINTLWENRRVLVIGDVMLDKYVWGTVDRISPEAPVPIVHGSYVTHCPGGAANVAMNLDGLGAKATIIGFVGEDEEASTLNATLAAAGVSTAFVAVPDFRTTSKLRILGNSQQMLRVDFENAESRPAVAYMELIQKCRDVIASCSAVVLSDYAKGVLNDSVCKTIINDARRLGVPVLVDPKSVTFEKYRNATTVCPNLQELSLVARNSSRDLDKLFEIGERYVEEYGFEFLTVTLGEKGIAIVRKGVRKRAPAVARQVFDVSGAGDTVIATLAVCLACGVEIESAMELANVAAGIVVSKVGTVPIEKDELIGALSYNIASRTHEKVVTREELRARVAGWRATRQRIVFTNGCYDLLHVGHINLLERAHEQGDKLIVAINSDDSTSRLKGPTRPIVGAQERAKILAALSVVDAIVIFEESTPIEIIRAVRPDVLVKGSDYTEDRVVGAAEVRSWGGRVCLVPLLGQFSTSELIAKASNVSAV